jgi:hypothetical protein
VDLLYSITADGHIVVNTSRASGFTYLTCSTQLSPSFGRLNNKLVEDEHQGQGPNDVLWLVRSGAVIHLELDPPHLSLHLGVTQTLFGLDGVSLILFRWRVAEHGAEFTEARRSLGRGVEIIRVAGAVVRGIRRAAVHGSVIIVGPHVIAVRTASRGECARHYNAILTSFF